MLIPIDPDRHDTLAQTHQHMFCFTLLQKQMSDLIKIFRKVDLLALETVMVVGPGPNATVRRWGGSLTR